jgi:hypothetical protein
MVLARFLICGKKKLVMPIDPCIGNNDSPGHMIIHTTLSTFAPK